MRPMLFAVAASAGLLAGCGADCRETVRLGDFEFSQGNYPRADKLYAEAWAADSLKCADAREKRERLQPFLNR